MRLGSRKRKNDLTESRHGEPKTMFSLGLCDQANATTTLAPTRISKLMIVTGSNRRAEMARMNDEHPAHPALRQLIAASERAGATPA